ncbi:hypothetical protein RchiOBHm_Chr5g0078401 [Rosa chinensis]|uniref:Uncharacterized protein n=1 Tax=Rosa chinensis TaxID=74649 RepID=A0A2P6QM82_ROSCH|nr:hypothetical protein RchiOBHm_Chr5g0078401 [Rosa chinensis]
MQFWRTEFGLEKKNGKDLGWICFALCYCTSEDMVSGIVELELVVLLKLYWNFGMEMERGL